MKKLSKKKISGKIEPTTENDFYYLFQIRKEKTGELEIPKQPPSSKYAEFVLQLDKMKWNKTFAIDIMIEDELSFRFNKIYSGALEFKLNSPLLLMFMNEKAYDIKLTEDDEVLPCKIYFDENFILPALLDGDKPL